MIMPYGPILFHDITYMAIIIMKPLFLQTMKNASCKKLITDRSKAEKVGTLKDTSLYGNFTFPVEGDFTWYSIEILGRHWENHQQVQGSAFTTN